MKNAPLGASLFLHYGRVFCQICFVHLNQWLTFLAADPWGKFGVILAGDENRVALGGQAPAGAGAAGLVPVAP
ncbi:hypothetical protein [Alicycliphilus denitrificans]|uniref:hypothetical protein n=1 Tax=Alicycliphilus denitrificans TaxID=179636 RepID=UPI000AC42654|nr:hypothetical protein [Alicycliphilus denitrificans]MBN9575425.1 hypothetical protein [Alicycliphilus denitrificans]